MLDLNGHSLAETERVVEVHMKVYGQLQRLDHLLPMASWPTSANKHENYDMVSLCGFICLKQKFTSDQIWGRSWLSHRLCKPLILSSIPTVSVEYRRRACLGKPEPSWFNNAVANNRLNFYFKEDTGDL